MNNIGISPLRLEEFCNSHSLQASMSHQLHSYVGFRVATATCNTVLATSECRVKSHHNVTDIPSSHMVQFSAGFWTYFFCDIREQRFFRVTESLLFFSSIVFVILFWLLTQVHHLVISVIGSTALFPSLQHLYLHKVHFQHGGYPHARNVLCTTLGSPYNTFEARRYEVHVEYLLSDAIFYA